LTRNRPNVLVLVVTMAVLGLALCALAGCGGSSSGTTTSSASSVILRPRDRAVSSARAFLKRYVTPDGRVSRLDQGGDTVGEGQAYGMLLAAAIGDQKRFDLIWGWTKSNIRRPDGLLSFLWKKGRVIDPQAASDADVDASRALLVASCRFKGGKYRNEALQLANSIMRVEIGSATFEGKPVLTAGPWAITPPPITVDPSYFAPRTFAELATAAKDPRWGAAATSSRAITSKLMPRAGTLPPDWAHLVGDTPVPIYSPSDQHRPPQFGFDAVRTLIRFAEDPDPAGRAIAARAWPAFQGADPTKLPVEHDLSGRPAGSTLHPVALVAAAGAADAAGDVSARDGLLDEAETLDRRTPTYYGSAWVALGRIYLTTKYLNTCT
jgi:endoglucanase